ncbi:MAG TPA: cold shock domain-containing protein [Bacteroidales bacterium]|nr:cold shock domain-containing protein [Bacteroidales bacterium]
MGRSSDSFGKRNVKSKQEQKRKQKEEKRLNRKDGDRKSGLDDMIAYVDENGMITSTPPDPDKKTKVVAEDIVISSPRLTDDADSNSERKGKLVQFNESRGFGFIKDLATGQDYFVHVSEFNGQLNEGDEVTFLISKGKRGLAATNVKAAI